MCDSCHHEGLVRRRSRPRCRRRALGYAGPMDSTAPSPRSAGSRMLSRMLGFVRDILIAAGLGTGAVADAYLSPSASPTSSAACSARARSTPRSCRCSPTLRGRWRGGVELRRGSAGRALSLVACSRYAAILAMPWLMVVIAPGFIDDPDKYALAVALTQIAFPYLLCMSVVALLSGVLNSLHRFWAAAAAPILLNVVLIGAIAIALSLGFARRPRRATSSPPGSPWPAWRSSRCCGSRCAAPGSSCGCGAAPDARRETARHARHPRRDRGRRHPDQHRHLDHHRLAARGAVSYLYYSDRLYQLPLGIVGVAVGVVLLPGCAHAPLGRSRRRSRRAEPLARVRRAAHAAGRRGARRLRRADRARAVRARRLRPRATRSRPPRRSARSPSGCRRS